MSGGTARPGSGPAGAGAAGGDHAPVRVLLADDQALVRSGFRLLLEAADDVMVVGEAVDGLDAVAQARQLRPDVVLMDVRMPRLDGLEATRRILAAPATRDVRVVVLTTFDLDEYVYAALRAGASGFLLKDIEPADLRAAVRVVAAGDALLAPAVTRRLISRFAALPVPGGSAGVPLERLTVREREIVRLVATGLSNDEIARDLVLSPATVKTHVNRAMTKLDARDRAQLVVAAYESGLVRAGERPADR